MLRNSVGSAATDSILRPTSRLVTSAPLSLRLDDGRINSRRSLRSLNVFRASSSFTLSLMSLESDQPKLTLRKKLTVRLRSCRMVVSRDSVAATRGLEKRGSTLRSPVGAGVEAGDG